MAGAESRWRIGAFRSGSAGGVHRVSAEIAGRELWFESPDAELLPAPEAFASVVLIPALQHGATIEVDAVLDPVWLATAARLPAIYADWWGYPARWPVAARGAAAPVERRASGAAVCFTGGVDSFHSVLTGGHRFDRLLFVHGYDIALADRARMDAFDGTLREVAEHAGATPLRLRTNLREHPIASSVNWERTHGAALAAAGLVAAPAIGSLTIPSSYRRALLRPWGSHPLTDPLWSTSRVAIVHDDYELGREPKLAAIVHDPLVAKHLRVCWENRTPAANCSACLKCVRTMVAISAHRPLGEFRLFDATVPVATRLDALPAISGHLVAPWRTLLELDLAPDARAALERLLARSEEPAEPVRRLGRLARRIVARLGGG